MPCAFDGIRRMPPSQLYVSQLYIGRAKLAAVQS